MRSPGSQSDFKVRLTQRFFVRLHMMLILLGVLATGLVSSKILLSAGLTSMLARYVVVLLLSYGSFFVLIRIWLWYVSSEPSRSVERSSGLDLPDVPLRLPGGRSQSGWPGSFGGGGRFSGAGAGGSWDSDTGVPTVVSNMPPIETRSSWFSSSRSKGSSGGWGSLDSDELVVLVVLGLLVIVILGVGSYIVYQAPVILSEVAFEALLASSLVRASQQMHKLGWAGSVLKATAIPFLLVLMVTIFFAVVAAIYCPEATKVADVLRGCN